MNLLSGLEKFGLDQMDTDHLFEEEKSDTPARNAPEPVPKRLDCDSGKCDSQAAKR